MWSHCLILISSQKPGYVKAIYCKSQWPQPFFIEDSTLVIFVQCLFLLSLYESKAFLTIAYPEHSIMGK